MYTCLYIFTWNAAVSSTRAPQPPHFNIFMTHTAVYKYVLYTYIYLCPDPRIFTLLAGKSGTPDFKVLPFYPRITLLAWTCLHIFTWMRQRHQREPRTHHTSTSSRHTQLYTNMYYIHIHSHVYMSVYIYLKCGSIIQESPTPTTLQHLLDTHCRSFGVLHKVFIRDGYHLYTVVYKSNTHNWVKIEYLVHSTIRDGHHLYTDEEKLNVHSWVKFDHLVSSTKYLCAISRDEVRIECEYRVILKIIRDWLRVESSLIISP